MTAPVLTTTQILARGSAVFGRAFGPAIAVFAVAALIYTPGWAATYYLVARNLQSGVMPLAAAQVTVVAIVVVTGFFELIPMGALLSLFAGTALDSRPSIAGALATGWKRIRAMLGVVLLSIGAMFGFFVVVFVLAVGLSFAVRQLPATPGIVVGLVVGIPLALAVIAAYVYIYTTITVAMSACTNEGSGPIASLSAAMARCLSPAQRLRTLWIGLASVVPLQVVGLALGAVAAFEYRAGPVPGTIAQVVDLAAQAFLFLLGYAWITVFSLDAKARLAR